MSYSSQQGIKASDFWLQVSSPGAVFYCGTNGTTVDCYPTLRLEPDGSKNVSNYSGSQIDGIAQKTSANEAGDVRWTLTYPQ